MTEQNETRERLEYLRQELRAERLSWSEVAELQDLAPHIEAGDVELLEAAGVPEFGDDEPQDRPEESDGYVNEPAYGSCVVSLDGRTIGTTDSAEEAFALLTRAMKDSGYWPNVWHVNERGNTTLVVIEDFDTGTYRFTDTAYV